MLIDFHVHCFPDRLAAGAVDSLRRASGYTPYTGGTFAETEEKLRDWGVDAAVLLNIAVTPHSQRKVNDFAVSVNDGARFFAFGSVHPDAPDALTELRRLKDAGIRGVKLHPAYQGFAADEPRAYPIYARCAELGLPVLFHGGWDAAFPNDSCSDPAQCARIVRDFPDCRFIFAHAGGMCRWDDVERLLCGRDVWLDLAFAAENVARGELSREQLLRILNSHDPRRVLFATDCPWSTPPRLSALLDELGIRGEARENIDWKNAAALLGL